MKTSPPSHTSSPSVPQTTWSLRAYLRDRGGSVVLGLLCAGVVGGIAALLDMGAHAAILLAGVVLGCWVCALGVDYARRRHFYRECVALVSKLEQPYLITSLLEEPGFLEGCLAYDALFQISRAATDEVAYHRERADAYREYVELWIHEIKTPIAAAQLIASRLVCEDAPKLKRELERIESYVEQALFYARSTSLESDYAIHEVSLADCAREVCKKHARFMIERGTTPRFMLQDERVFADAKWLVFVMGQVVVNAAKYGATTVTFSAQEDPEQHATVLEIADDGRGIPAADVPRVFERGFTGENGRLEGSSTGMGLYLAAVMCEKMGLGLRIASEEGVGTRVMFAFPHDRRQYSAVLQAAEQDDATKSSGMQSLCDAEGSRT